MNVLQKELYKNLGVDDFASLFGEDVCFIPENCKKLIRELDFRYQIIRGDKRDKLILDIIEEIYSGKLRVSGSHRIEDWEKGWSENLNEFEQNKYDLDKLTPKYYRPDSVLRINDQYCKTIDPDFQYNFFTVYRLWLFERYFKKYDDIYEFGCGPGHNMVSLAQLYPEKNIVGLDWSEKACELIEKVRETYKYKISARQFDMFHPDKSMQIRPDSLIYTFGALEQLGDNVDAFIQYVLDSSSGLCVNVEPICEFYDVDNLADYLAVQYHRKRNYLWNYFGRLEKLQGAGKISILKSHRVKVGSLNEEGWSYIVWRPC